MEVIEKVNEKVKGFIVYPTYKLEDGKAYVYLFGRLESGESFLTINAYRPYFFIKTKDRENAEKLIKLDYEDTDFHDFAANKMTKVTLEIPGNVPNIRKLFQDNEIISYEADIRFAYRYLIDKDLKSVIMIEGKPEDGRNLQPAYFTNIGKVFMEPKLHPLNEKDHYFPKLKVLAFDIETNRDASQLFSISFYSKDFQTVLLLLHEKYRYHHPKIKNAELFTDEAELLKRFKEIILWHDPDIITGWNMIDFDLKILKQRFDKQKIEFKIGRVSWECKLRFTDNYFTDSTAEIPGRIALDGIHLMKISFVKLSDYKLNTAAKVFLGEQKLITTGDRRDEIERQYEHEPQALVDYNLKDSKLAYDIIHKSKTLELSITRSMLTRMQIDRVKASIASLDSLYLRELQNRKLVAPTAIINESEERIKGGFVMDSKPGIYENILVFDFKSLYPSVIRTFNIDPVSFVDSKQLQSFNDTDKKKLIHAPNGAYFRNEQGILPELIQHLFDLRERAKKEKNDLESNAIKILMNSFFGVLANPTCRFYSLEVANAITHFGQFIIKLSGEKIRELGYDVIYGDTDSLFVNPNVSDKLIDYEEAQKIGTKIQKFIEEFYVGYIKENYNRKSFLELKFEKTFKKFILPKVRGSDEGAKKRYAGIVEKDGKDTTEFTGLEFVRRDWTDAAKKFQLELLSIVFESKINAESEEEKKKLREALKTKVSKYIKDYIADLKKGEYDSLLVYKKAIRKGVESYTKTTPPHIKAARKAGRTDSGIIEYLQTVNGPEVIEARKSAIDYPHYLEKQIKPIAESILGFFDINFDDLFADSRQMKLGGF